MTILGVTIGASCTFTRIRKELTKIIEQKGFQPTQPLAAIIEMLYWFAGDQIRNVGVKTCLYLIKALIVSIQKINQKVLLIVVYHGFNLERHETLNLLRND